MKEVASSVCNSQDAQVVGLPLPLWRTAKVLCINSTHFILENIWKGMYAFQGPGFMNSVSWLLHQRPSFVSTCLACGGEEHNSQFGAAAALTHMKYQHLHLPLP